MDGPACSRCGEPAARRQGHQWLCAMHYRFGQMRCRAKQDGKVVPSHADLHEMAAALVAMACPHCSCEMTWLRERGAAVQATLQHYRSGALGLICLSCNTRHAQMPGDEFCDLPEGHKRCPGCERTLPLDSFALDRSRFNQAKTYCKECSNDRHRNWKRSNREFYNLRQREYRAKRKASGVPVRGGN